jgi:hypothetical protein
VKILREYCAEKELPTEFYKLKYKQSRTWQPTQTFLC